jgi:hypothetical protein
VTGHFFLENGKSSWYSTDTEIYRAIQEEDGKNAFLLALPLNGHKAKRRYNAQKRKNSDI